MFYDELAEKVRYHKQDSEGVKVVSQIVEEYGDERAAEALQQGIRQGIKQGTLQKAIETAKTMLADNLSPEKTALYSGLPLEQVLELRP